MTSPGRCDTRRFSRRDALLPVVVRAAGNRVEAGLRLNTADLSEGGVFLRSDLLFEVGESLSLEIPLAAGETLAARGRVAWVTRGGGGEMPAGMGIEFERLSAQDRRRLTQSLQRLAQPASRKSA
ncbi:MAG TPA: PilZ domain-containing protein [Polyangia bacterium]|nr:PilZ domain-containing protein [Polyangia bacterium]